MFWNIVTFFLASPAHVFHILFLIFFWGINRAFYVLNNMVPGMNNITQFVFSHNQLQTKNNFPYLEDKDLSL